MARLRNLRRFPAMARRWNGDGEAAELEAVVVEGVLARKLKWNPRDHEMLSLTLIDSCWWIPSGQTN